MNQSVGNLEIEFWHIGLATLGILLSVFASGHAVLNKRDSRSAIAWVGFVWLVPLAGAVLYFIGVLGTTERKIRLRVVIR